MNCKKVKNKEIKQFLSEHYGKARTESFLGPVRKGLYSELQYAAEQGIQEGFGDYLRDSQPAQKPDSSTYFYESVPKEGVLEKLLEKLEDMPFKLTRKKEFALDLYEASLVFFVKNKEIMKFQGEEIKRFLSDFQTKERTESVIGSIDRSTFIELQTVSEMGIKEGVGDYTKSEHSIYESADLAQFVFKSPVKKRILMQVQKLPFKIRHKGAYAEDVSEGYSTFVYNDSRSKFLEKFNKSSSFDRM